MMSYNKIHNCTYNSNLNFIMHIIDIRRSKAFCTLFCMYKRDEHRWILEHKLFQYANE